MITSNKKVNLLIASAILISPIIASADDSMENMDMSASGNISVQPVNQTTMSGILNYEQKAKLGEIMKSLELELKNIRENLNKENAEEMKKKAEELKNAYLAKINETFPNIEEAKKIIENRFKIFWNNQFIIREQAAEIKDKAKEEMEKAREIAKKSYEKAKEVKKNGVEKIKNEMKEVKNEMKDKYKKKFQAQIKNKLDNIPVEKLQIVYDKVKAKRDAIAANTQIKEATKQKYLAQIDALLEIIAEKLNPESNDELDLNQILDEATSSN